MQNQKTLLDGRKQMQLMVAFVIVNKLITLCANVLRYGVMVSIQPRQLIAFTVPIALMLWLYLSGSKLARGCTIAVLILLFLTLLIIPANFLKGSYSTGIWLPGLLWGVLSSIVYLIMARQLIWSPSIEAFLAHRRQSATSKGDIGSL